MSVGRKMRQGERRQVSSRQSSALVSCCTSSRSKQLAAKRLVIAEDEEQLHRRPYKRSGNSRDKRSKKGRQPDSPKLIQIDGAPTSPAGRRRRESGNQQVGIMSGGNRHRATSKARHWQHGCKKLHRQVRAKEMKLHQGVLPNKLKTLRK